VVVGSGQPQLAGLKGKPVTRPWRQSGTAPQR